MDALFHTLFSSFVLLFIVIDPIGVAAIFAALSHEGGPAYQRRMALRGILLAGGILFTFVLVGNYLLAVLGIGVPAFRIAGGVLLFMIALDMMFARPSGLRYATVRERREAQQKEDISVFPLAFPLISGPGAMTTVLLMSGAGHDAAVFTGLLLVILCVLILSYLALRTAPFIVRILGETGINVVNRLLGLILAALAVQFVIDGVKVSLFNG